jgi:hypothetical protein
VIIIQCDQAYVEYRHGVDWKITGPWKQKYNQIHTNAFIHDATIYQVKVLLERPTPGFNPYHTNVE